ncbi:MAG: arylsulfatase [Thermoguttaceae bacterium]
MLAVAVALLACAGWVGMVHASRRPNVLLIVTDDQGWGDIHSHGNPQIDTPVLDRLAAEGARFERFFVSPVCSPTRASLLTGRYSLRTGVHDVTRGGEAMRSQEVTLAEILREAGYATGCFGKWHNGRHVREHPNGQGFDEFFGFCGGHWNRYFDPVLEHNGSPVQARGYITDILAEAAIRFLEKHRGGPMFCYVAFNAPHAPFQLPDRYFQKYKARGLSDKNAAVYGMCESVDQNIGRLLASLDALGLTEQTIVVFLTDNGPNGADRFNGGMKGAKGSVDEGGLRVPLFIRWPGHIPAGTLVKPITAHIDLLPTLVELCGLELPKGLALDGLSVVRLLQGHSAGWPDRKLFAHWSGASVRPSPGSVRTERWRAVRRRDWELYDMKADPGQKHNVAGQFPEVLRQLAAAYEAWFEEVTRAGFDQIPAVVGDPRRDLVELPAHEATLVPAAGGGISYVTRNGWANEWITHWTDAGAYPAWKIEVVRPGRYEAALLYCCPAKDVGSRVLVEIGKARTEGVVRQAHDPPPLPSLDRFADGPNRYLTKSWARLLLGQIDLEAGVQPVCVRALSKPGSQVMELKALQLRRLD